MEGAAPSVLDELDFEERSGPPPKQDNGTESSCNTVAAASLQDALERASNFAHPDCDVWSDLYARNVKLYLGASVTLAEALFDAACKLASAHPEPAEARESAPPGGMFEVWKRSGFSVDS